MKSTQSQTVNITIPKALLKQVDALAKRDYTSRSDVIRQALLQRIRQPKLDEWGDPVSENWQKIIDFRDKAHPNGVLASDLLAAMDKHLAND